MRFRNLGFAFLTLLLTVVIAISFGPIHLPFNSVIKTLLNLPGHLTGNERTVLLDIRAPRILLAILVGSALAASGAVYQTVFRNPLADPYLLGAAAGAGLGATIAIINNSSAGTLPIFAFFGSVAPISFLYSSTAFSLSSAIGMLGPEVIYVIRSLKNDFPLIIRYTVANLGEIKMVLAPIKTK
mgnify:CR=1 FL=1